MNPYRFPFVAVALLAGSCLRAAHAGTPTGGEIEQTDLFISGTGGYHTYRIPAILLSPKGHVLAFCEARKESHRGGTPTDLVLRRSTDGGKSWLPMQVLIHLPNGDAIMYPVPVVDPATRAIVLVCTRVAGHTATHYGHLLITSTDDGETWSEPVDLAPRIAAYDDTFMPGSGIGIATRSGRLVIPGCTGVYDLKTETGCYSRVLYSDDHGKSWRLGAPVGEFTDESQVVELADGRLMLNMRQNVRKKCRAVALSGDGGESWSKVYWDPALNECPCQASFIRYTLAGPDDRNRLLFANPDIAGERFASVERARMTLKLSYDEGRTWPVKKLIHAGPSAYSSLVRLPDGRIGLLFEGGEKHRREWIRFVRLTLDRLTDGDDSFQIPAGPEG